ncbi:MAG: alpha-L-fucosidase [Pirellulales bacterium]|nr:alpha-L-fucosidase [Pirellulales bacterium]
MKIEHLLGALIVLSSLLLPGQVDGLKMNDEGPIYEAADQSSLDMADKVTLPAQARPSTLNYELGPIPDSPEPLPVNSVPMADSRTFEEVKLDLPVTSGPFEPTWESIEANYPGTPEWLREAKFGLWIHYGPQSAGKSGDWYARKLYDPGKPAYKNHLENYGHPSEVGYKEVLRDWNPDQLDPEKLVEIYKDAGVRFLIIQGVHHDQFDSWDSKYQPWNSVNMGPKRDLIGEWQTAARKADIRFGITFHHEYAWWWYQTAFESDTEGPKAGVPYDGHLTLDVGKGKWWEGLDPRMLYGINLLEYRDVASAAHHSYRPPNAGIFHRHLDFAEWYAKWWALRIMDAVDKYQPDFIYTDGTVEQPFCGYGTGTGYKCDAMQRVIADFYNKTLARRGKVDVFSIVKFRSKTNGTVNTAEGGHFGEIKKDQDWIGEAAVGDWFYRPGFTYSSDAVIRYLLEQVSRDGAVGLSVALLPDGSLDDGSAKMLKETGDWMRINGEGIYGSRAWDTLGEGAHGRLNVLRKGFIGAVQARQHFSTSDFRFTVGKDGSLYAYCMVVPKAGEELCITSLGTDSALLAGSITAVELLGHSGKLKWTQDADVLRITCPPNMDYKTAIGFQIGPRSIVLPPLPAAPDNLSVITAGSNTTLTWGKTFNADATYTVKRATEVDGLYETLATGLKETTWTDSKATPGARYYYVVAVTLNKRMSPDSDAVLALLPKGEPTWLSQDIGSTGEPGSFVQSGDTVLVKGTGTDIWNTADGFYYVYEMLDGDGSITAKVESMQDTAPWAKAGLMIRESLDADSRQIIAFMSPSNGAALQGRSRTSGSSSGFGQTKGLKAPYWLRLERDGNVFTAHQSPDGKEWTSLGETTMDMSAKVKVGLAVCSSNAHTPCQAVFTHVENTR